MDDPIGLGFPKVNAYPRWSLVVLTLGMHHFEGLAQY